MNRRSVLLLDGDDALREATALMLRHRGSDVASAATAREAAELAGDRRLDVLVCEAQSADRGADMLAALRTAGVAPKRTILCCDDADGARAAGFDEVLARPYPFDRLLDAIAAGPARSRSPSGVFRARGTGHAGRRRAS
jgi:DNA-binding response OmpR family regulator